jgi:transcriptional regulator with XRE-family HTH domain|tara:strand:+ start:1774 stop:2007 length:234 start_codon:yes stop_codon:yes gene_type:complete
MIKSTSSNKYTELLQWLRKKRLEQGLTVRQVAHLIDEPFQFISKVEKGERNLSVYEYVQYCKALKIDYCEGLKYLDK